MPIQYIEKDIAEIVDKGKNFDRLLSRYHNDGWELMSYEAITLRDGMYHSAIISRSEDAFFKTMVKQGGYFNAANQHIR